MRERVVVVLGAGNLRCGPVVLASLANWRPDDLVDIRLWDSNEERLDLFDRLSRELIDKANTEHKVVSTADVAEALEGATDVIFTVHEDCARRLTGLHKPTLFVPDDSFEDQVRGDPNKPTHPESLSPQTQVILSSPANVSEPREEVVTRALRTLLAQVPVGARVLSLQRGIPLPTDMPHTWRDWPAEIPEGNLAIVPHQILRWIQGDETMSDLLAEAARSPVTEWLAESV